MQSGVGTVQHGDVLQINPEWEVNRAFAGCFVVVDGVRAWGVTGYVQCLGASRSEPGTVAPIRVEWADLEPTGGKAAWIAEGF